MPGSDAIDCLELVSRESGETFRREGGDLKIGPGGTAVYRTVSGAPEETHTHRGHCEKGPLLE
jgi:hypothetical protein